MNDLFNNVKLLCVKLYIFTSGLVYYNFNPCYLNYLDVQL